MVKKMLQITYAVFIFYHPRAPIHGLPVSQVHFHARRFQAANKDSFILLLLFFIAFLDWSY